MEDGSDIELQDVLHSSEDEQGELREDNVSDQETGKVFLKPTKGKDSEASTGKRKTSSTKKPAGTRTRKKSRVTLDNDDAEPPKKQGGNTPQKRLSKVREFSPDLRKKLAQKVLDTANEEVPAAPTAIKVVAPLTGTMFKPAAAATPSPPSLSGLDRSLLMSSSSGSSSPTSSPASSPVSSPAHKIVFGTPSRTRVHDEARVRELEARFLSRLEPVALFTGSETASNAPTTSVSAPVVSVLNSDTTQPVQANNLPAVVNTNTPAATNPNADMAAFEMLGVVLPAPPTRTFAKPTDDRLIRKADKRAKQHRVPIKKIVEANFHNEKEYNEGMHAELVSLVDPGYEAFRETNGHIYAAYESVIKYVFTRARERFGRAVCNKISSYYEVLRPVTKEGTVVLPESQLVQQKAQILPTLITSVIHRQPTESDLEWYSLGPWAQALKKIEKLEIQRAKMVAAAAAAANAAGGADNN